MRHRRWIAVAALGALFASATAFAQVCPEGFDAATPPNLPGNWAGSKDGAGADWTTVTTTVDSAPNAAFVPNATAVGNSYLTSQPTYTGMYNGGISFRHWYQTENTYDGAVLEVSVNGGPFVDVQAAGGVFSEGGYNGTISAAFGNPIAGRQAWTGDSGGYITTKVRLPWSTAGSTIQWRWRMASDDSFGQPGWHIDTIRCGNGASSPWVHGPPTPMPLMYHATTVMNGILYSFGGWGTGATALAKSYRFDGQQWIEIGALPAPRMGATAVNDGAYIYILGGKTDSDITKTLYRYTPQTNTYETRAPSSRSSWAASAVVVAGKIVKFGGDAGPPPGGGGGFPGIDATEIYDIASNTWSSGVPYPQRATRHSGFARSGHVYGAGGETDLLANSSKTYRYDVAGNLWDDAPIPDLPIGRMGSATIETPVGAMLVGGELMGSGVIRNVTGDVIVWDGQANRWWPMEPLLLPRARMAGGIVGGRICVVGGRPLEGGFGGTTDVQCLDRVFGDGFDRYW